MTVKKVLGFKLWALEQVLSFLQVAKNYILSEA